MTESRYHHLGLVANPFPSLPTVDPASHDARMNGSIYNAEIVSEQLASLHRLIRRRENLIYAQNTRFVVGVGKSALIIHEWRLLSSDPSATSVYVRCGPKLQANSVDTACNAIIDALFRRSVFWRVVCGILRMHTREVDKAVIDRGVIEALAATNPEQPRTVRLSAYMLWDIDSKIGAISNWLEGQSGRMERDIVALFLTDMLSQPAKFQADYPKKARRREVLAFVTMLELMRVGGVEYLYIFLDQFETLFLGQGKKTVIELAESMREILLASTGFATFVVTLHPSAAMQLTSVDGQSLTTIAPLDTQRVVELPNISARQAVELARTYLSQFRSMGASREESSAPFEDVFIETVAEDPCDGNIRLLLQVLYRAVEVAAEQGVTSIDQAFLAQHYEEITGRVSEEDVDLG